MLMRVGTAAKPEKVGTITVKVQPSPLRAWTKPWDKTFLWRILVNVDQRSRRCGVLGRGFC